MTTVRYPGQVVKGQVVLSDPHAWRAAVARHEGRMVWLTVVRQSTAHTMSQRHYYHGVVCKYIGDHIGEHPDEVHELLKQELLKKRSIEILDGKKIQMPPSTKHMTLAEFSEYLEECKVWAASFLGLYIPEPNQMDVAV